MNNQYFNPYFNNYGNQTPFNNNGNLNNFSNINNNNNDYVLKNDFATFSDNISKRLNAIESSLRGGASNE